MNWLEVSALEKVKEILSFYTPYANIDRMIKSLKVVLQEEITAFKHQDSCIILHLKQGEYLRIPYVSVESDVEVFQKQIQRLYASIEKKHCANTFVKQNLLYQIALFRGAYVFEFDYDEDKRDDKILPLMEIADQMDALIFWETGDVSDSFGDVILSKDGNSEVTVFNPVDGFDLSNRSLGLSEIQMKRIHRSMSILRYKGIYAPNHIAPPYDEHMYIFQDEQDIMKRCVACMLLAIYSDFLLTHNGNAMLAYQDVEKMIRLYHASPYFTIQEIEFLNEVHPSEEKIHVYQGYYECCYTLLWVLGFVDNLYFPSALCSDSLVVRTIFNYDSMEKLFEQIHIRSKSELLDALDLVQRYVWACKDARKLGFEMPAGLLHDVVVLRHHALSWLVSDAPWDEIVPVISSLGTDK